MERELHVSRNEEHELPKIPRELMERLTMIIMIMIMVVIIII